MSPWLAGAVVFFSSAAVLILEILAGRVLAPYVGLRLETYTAVIGTVLAGIAVGTWMGGRLADRVEPRRMVGPLLVTGGILALASVPIVHMSGTVGRPTVDQVVFLAVAAFFAPAAVLSAVVPTVVKLQLRDLRVTGQVVGWLSAVGTAGALVGTFLAGFVLVAAAPTSTVIVAVGVALVVGGAVLWWRLGRAAAGTAGPALVVALVTAAGATAWQGPCDVETRYHCARVVTDPGRPAGRELVLDVLRHSYVDLDDPTHLELRYTKVFADVVVASLPGGPLSAVHIGGGGFTLPRYLATIHPRSRHLVLEIDPGLVDVARRHLGLVTGPGLEVRVGDARLLLRDLPAGSADLVVGDAFGDLAVPWHLTTVEFSADVKRALRPGGVYLLNLIDHPPLRFARAQVATLDRVFEHVAVIAPPPLLDGTRGGNYVLAASDRPFDGEALAAGIGARSGEEAVLVEEEAVDFAAGSRVLTDDYAPVDQWLARSRRAR